MLPVDSLVPADRQRVAVVGAGPAGLYCSLALLDDERQIAIDVIDRLPTPFGLVRSGVAPDHAHIKNVQRVLRRPFDSGRVRFIGNVEIGTDVSHEQLTELYDAVVYAYGAEEDNVLSLPGGHDCVPAGQFVRWYNAHPDRAADDFILHAEAVAVVGGGNVALDVARFIARTAEEMAPTDVPQHVLEALESKRVREVHLVVRGRPEQARFTPVELEQLQELATAEVILHLGPSGLPDPEEVEDRRTRQNVQVLHGFSPVGTGAGQCTVHIHFEARPVRLVGSEKIEGLVVENPDGRETVLPVGMVISAIGFRGRPLPGIPFDHDRGKVPNASGRVLDGEAPVPGVYVAGWLKRGPSGVIGTNKADGVETARAVLEDLAPRATRANRDVLDLLPAETRSVTWGEWLLLEQHEETLGATWGRGRVKHHERAAMLVHAHRDAGSVAHVD